MDIHESEFIKDNFFYISSENIETVTPRLYGFAFCDNTLYINTRKNILCPQFCTGMYTNVHVSDSSITIQQDYNGSTGIFLYKENGFFALSNSLFYLVSNLKRRLTLNRAYAKYMVAENLAFALFDETPIKEICLLPRDNYVIIDKTSKNCQIKYNEKIYREIAINTIDGIQLLDEWHTHFRNFICGLVANNKNVHVDLSGGYDSRASFALVASEKNILNKCRINSGKGAVKDFKIATKISNELKFSLNKVLTQNHYAMSLDDLIAANLFMTMGFHQHLYGAPFSKLCKVTGSGGEIHRENWSISQEQFLQRILLSKSFLPASWKHEISALVNQQINKIKNYFKIDESYQNELLDRVYREGRARSHFGKGTMISFLFGQLAINPLMDYRLDKINPFFSENDDKTLLMALIYTRYTPEICHIEFAGTRKLSPKTIDIAQKLNKDFPLYTMKKDFSMEVIDETEVYPHKSLQSYGKKDLQNFFVDLLVDCNIAQQTKSIFGDDFYKIALREQDNFAKNKNVHLQYRFAYTLVSFSLLKEMFSLE